MDIQACGFRSGPDLHVFVNLVDGRAGPASFLLQRQQNL
jgi:hypothetical protein